MTHEPRTASPPPGADRDVCRRVAALGRAAVLYADTPMDSPIRDRAWVAARLDAGETVTAIAAAARVSRQTAHTWIKRHGLHGHPQAKPRPSKRELAALYKRHRSAAKVAEELEVAPGTAHRWLIEAGVALPAPGPPRRTLDLAAARRRRAAGATYAELAAEFGVSPETIRSRLTGPA